MWMVFSKCAESIEEGKRLENLSWRLWNRETFCCEAQPHLATTPAIKVPSRRLSSKEIPELSASVESITSEDAEKSRLLSLSKTTTRSSEANQDSALSRSRGKEKHITPQGLEKMVINIKEKTELEPLSPSIEASLPAISGPLPDLISDITPRPSSPFPTVDMETSPSDSQLRNSTDSCYSAVTAESSISERKSEHRGSDTSVSSDGLIKSGSVVHGFSPSQMPSSLRTKATLAPQVTIPARPNPSSKAPAPKKGGIFMLGGSSGDDESSFEDRMSLQGRKNSSLSEGLAKPLAKGKVPSYKEIVQSRIDEGAEDEDVIASDEEEEDDGEASESAIEEDDGDWESSTSDSARSSPEDKSLFKRVESQANLVSRRSVLTMQLHEPERAAALASAASRSTPVLRRSRTSSPTGPSLPGSPDDNDNILTMRGPGSARPMPIITTTTNTHASAHSPRTTRRNMMATELTESLRKDLLWERQQKSMTANAVFKRRHTAQNMAHLPDYPSTNRPGPEGADPSRNNSWNHYFDAPWEYHTKGW